MIAQVNVAPVGDFADIEAILEQVCERSHAEPAAAHHTPARQLPPFGADAITVEVLDQGTYGAQFEVSAEYRPDDFGFLRDDDKFLVDGRIPQRDRAADPYALAFRGRYLVTYALTNDFPFELRK